MWSTSNGMIISGQNSQSAVAGSAGVYIFQVTNTTNNCTSKDTVTVAVDTLKPAFTIQPFGVLNCKADTIQLITTITPLAAIPQWTASNGGIIASGTTTKTPKVVAAGNYLLVATDTLNGCMNTLNATVNEDHVHPLVVIAPADSLTCQHPSITLSATGSSAGLGYSDAWTTTGGNIVSGADSLNPVVNAAGTYQLMITNTANGCTNTANVQVIADASTIKAVATAPDTLTCLFHSVSLQSTGSSTLPGLQYAWTIAPNSTGHIVSGANTPNPTVDAPGTYQLLLTNTATGCTATDLAIAIQDTATPNVKILQPDTITCAHPFQTITAVNASTGGFFGYTWTAQNGGNIVSGASSLTPVVDAPGRFICFEINFNNGCSASDTTFVYVETGVPIIAIATPDTITCTHPTILINTAGSSTGPNFAYQWTAQNGGNLVSTPNTESPVTDSSGVYQLTITNTSNGCTATSSVAVVQNLTNPPAGAGTDGLINCTTPVFNLIANAGSTTNGLQFQWSTSDGHVAGNSTSASTTCDLAGAYHLLVTDPVNGCTATDDAVVSSDFTAPQVTTAVSANLTCTTTISTITTMGGIPSFIYQWQSVTGVFTSGQNSPTPIVSAPGMYSLTVTNPANGCTGTSAATVTQDTIAPVVSAGPPATLTCTQVQTTLQGSAGQGSGLVLSWTTGNGHIVSGANTTKPVVDAPGLYVFTALNPQNGCTQTGAVAISQNILHPAVEAGPDDTLSCSVASLTLSGMATAGGIPMIQWTTANGGHILSGSSTLNASIDAPGLYILSVTDPVNGCSTVDSLHIYKDANAPVVSINQPATLTCILKQTTLQATGTSGNGITYNWAATNGGNIQSGNNTANPVVNAPGVYSITVTNPLNGCTATAQTSVMQHVTPPSITIAPPAQLTCVTTALTLSGSSNGPNLSYAWTTLNGNIQSGGNSPTPVVSKAGTYKLVITDNQNGCTAADSVQVISNTVQPVASIALPPVLDCINHQAQFSSTVSQPAAGFTVNWSTTNGHIVSGQTTLNPVVDAPGIYTLTVKDQLNGCTTTTATTVVQNTVPPVAHAGTANILTCINLRDTLNGSTSTGMGTLTYSWSSASGQISGGAATAMPVIQAPGTYILVIKDTKNGCTATDSVKVLQQIDHPKLAIAPPLLLNCIRDTVDLNATGSDYGPGFALTWSTISGQLAGGSTALIAQAAKTGSYTLVIKNLSNGCTSTGNIAVSADFVPPTADAGLSQTIHCNQSVATLQGSGQPAGNIQFAWMTANGHILNGGNAPAPAVDAPGTYILTVTNTLNGCTATDSASVSEIPLPAFLPRDVQPNCITPKGSVDFGPITGGTPPFQYSTDGGQHYTNKSITSGLSPGLYQLVVIDQNGCTASTSLILNQPTYPTAYLPPVVTLESGNSDTLSAITVPPFSLIQSWEWTPSNGLSCTDCPNPILTPKYPLTYQLKITDQQGCTAVAHIQVLIDKDRYIYAPNIFSPNDDGRNDRFIIYGRNVVEIKSLQIFDRWGSLVWDGSHLGINNEQVGWDGRVKGARPVPGVYVWTALIEFTDGASERYTGDITILR
jgi:gliding motility-associated-like protein